MAQYLILVLLSFIVSFNSIASQDSTTVNSNHTLLHNTTSSCNSLVSCLRIVSRIVPLRIKFDLIELYDYITGYEASKLKQHYSLLKAHLINEIQIVEETTFNELKFINESILFITEQKKIEEDKFELLKEIFMNQK